MKKKREKKSNEKIPISLIRTDAELYDFRFYYSFVCICEKLCETCNHDDDDEPDMTQNECSRKKNSKALSSPHHP